ncbi:MAG: eukaryotic-like serine/threonine-protein kinase [Acidimicrobiaceae bacterium]|jgi:serine/threonine-protein kinase|nr:eukaryotic-like serine/threonine-protein kinase [Acidimicrobiaceae bacterium]
MSRIADHVGRVLGGRYRLLAPIGTGGSAHVYLAEDSTLRRRVAVKLLHAALADDESFLRRFRAEAQAAAALNHPNIMRVFDWGEDEDGPYLVLEYLSGGSLRDVLDRGRRLTPAQAASVGGQAAKALDYAHRRGLVHRDIKPANLLFDEEGRLCIADFGVARALAEATWTEPAGSMVGTARYAAPEQAKGGSLDGKADVYALGLVLIEAVTGEVPFQADTTLATLMARVDTPVVAPPELGPLAPMVEAAGRPVPSERPDAADFARQAEAAARDLPEAAPLNLVGPAAAETARGAGAGADLGAGVGDLTEVRSRPRLYDREADHGIGEGDITGFTPLPLVEPAKAGRRRRRWPIVLGVLLAVLAIAAGAYAVVQVATPSHPVPRVQGASVLDARRALAVGKFKLAESHRYDEAVPKDTVLAQDPAAGVKRKEGSAVHVVVSDGPAPRAVPTLANLTEQQAVDALHNAGFVAAVVPASSDQVAKGIVLSWTPQGTQPKGASITITVSSGPPIVAIPDNLVGQPYDAAAKALADAGFVSVRKDDYSDDVPDVGKVVSLSPSGLAAKGSKVTVLVSKGPKTVAVPGLFGDKVNEANGVLDGAGLTLGNLYGPPKGRVFATNPSEGRKVPRGTAVDIYTA